MVEFFILFQLPSTNDLAKTHKKFNAAVNMSRGYVTIHSISIEHRIDGNFRHSTKLTSCKPVLVSTELKPNFRVNLSVFNVAQNCYFQLQRHTQFSWDGKKNVYDQLHSDWLNREMKIVFEILWLFYHIFMKISFMENCYTNTKFTNVH